MFIRINGISINVDSIVRFMESVNGGVWFEFITGETQVLNITIDKVHDLLDQGGIPVYE